VRDGGPQARHDLEIDPDPDPDSDPDTDPDRDRDPDRDPDLTPAAAALSPRVFTIRIARVAGTLLVRPAAAEVRRRLRSSHQCVAQAVHSARAYSSRSPNRFRFDCPRGP